MDYLLSTATFASPQTKSLRATIPEGVVAYLGLDDGERLEWRMEIEEGEKVVKVRKAEIDKTTKLASKYAKTKRDSK